ncbi:MFS transporter [Uliginosibacterium aquaticum]|uniref:MFS transporter n=1 Tax=Uliginosibacterium aquaticum TaxID=2731212 RepID=A0ABX2IQL2_9RHOO|nr:MFS transporter [Uliginosibacterium aquaticum]NSL56994.1 MFS transporter [Uliginosibacterium aquaticum]
MSIEPSRSTLQLLGARRFGPLFLTQFCGAFNDNVFKNTLLLLITFQAGQVLGLAPALAVQLAAGLFVLPFFLFSALAGQLADKYDKSRLIRIIKAVEIGIAVVASVGFFTRHVELLLFALFMMGLHSTFFGPLKYSILPQHLHPDELVAGNAWVESGTFVAILAGSVLSGLLMAIPQIGADLCGVLTVIVAGLGYAASRRIPPAPSPAPELKVSHNFIAETWRNLKLAARNKTVFMALLGISWFWFFGALLLTEFAPYVQGVLGGDELMVTTLLGTFIVGIATGSFLCERLSGKHVELGLVPLGTLCISLFAFDLWLASPTGTPAPVTLAGFLAKPASWRILLDMVMIGIGGGFFTVPLYALMQSRSNVAERSRIIAANNILNAAFMVASAGITAGLLAAGLTIPQLFLVCALLNLLVAGLIYRAVPEFYLRCIAWSLTHSIYRVAPSGLANVPASGPALAVCNHVSFADAVILMGVLPRQPRFVIDHQINRTPLVRWLFRASRCIPVASAQEDRESVQRAYEEIARALDAGELIFIFPEGTITRDGEIGPFKGGLNKILRRNPVPVVPMALRGLWGGYFSRAYGSAMSKLFPRGLRNRVELVVGEALAPEGLKPVELRARIAQLRGEWR